jgi:ATP-dependent DNA helicase RecQ
MDRFALLLIAPAGSGKTWLIINLIRKIPCRIVFISPLRALANEFHEKVKDSSVLYSSGDEIPLNQNLVTTVEQITSSFWDRIDLNNTVFVLDEIHLFYKWGKSFRERLFMFLEDLYSKEASTILLTATLEEHLLSEMKIDLKRNYTKILIIDKGNMQIKNLPQKRFDISYCRYSLKDLVMYHYFKSDDSVLIFCKYRSEVDQLQIYFSKYLNNVLGCVGGEVDEFCQKLKITKTKRLIISTTCLSHGVNLPKISKIFFTYKVQDSSLYLQMIARGGRCGEVFDIYSINEDISFKNQLLQLPRLKCEVILGKIRLSYEIGRNCFKQTFSQIKRPYL